MAILFDKSDYTDPLQQAWVRNRAGISDAEPLTEELYNAYLESIFSGIHLKWTKPNLAAVPFYGLGL